MSSDTITATDQPPALLENYHALQSDPVLLECLQATELAWARSGLMDFGAAVGDSAMIAEGFLANRYTPKLHTYDRRGRRIDQVEFHPAYHKLMDFAFGAGIHSIAWTAGQPGAHQVHAAMVYLLTQLEPGVCCPAAMTYAVAPVLRAHPALRISWLPKVLTTAYDPRFLPATDKKAVTFGMAMTEKQGGSDVRANTTEAKALSEDGYALFGHKWFCSAPMSDAFLTLAQTTEGLSCFLAPRWQPDGSPNPFHIRRLKDKLGNRSNASAEIEYHATWAQLVGEPGRGVKTIIEMVQHTRLDASAAPAGLMRQALLQALHYCRHRAAFGKRLNEHALMQNLLADLALESEAAVRLMLRAAAAFDAQEKHAEASALARVLTAIAKYWLNKRCPGFVYEALECLGGNGYVEDWLLPRLYREAPVNSIWEGSGNIICLDVLRALSKQPACVVALIDELNSSRGELAGYDQSLAALQRTLQSPPPESSARRLTEALALLLQTHLFIHAGHADLAAIFYAARLGSESHHCYGALPTDTDCKALLNRFLPE